MQRQALRSGEMAQRGLGAQREIVSNCLSVSVLPSPLSSLKSWTLNLGLFISYQGASSAQVLYTSTSDLGSLGQVS